MEQYKRLLVNIDALKEYYGLYIKRFGKPSDGLELGLQHLNAEVLNVIKDIAVENKK